MMAQALMFGLDVGIYGRLATRDYILELATLAEVSGLESLWVADHVIFPATLTSAYPYSATGTFPLDMTQEPLLEPLATMGVLVGATQRVKIGTAVLVMPYRHPVLLARMLVTLDVLSGGRTLLGAGVGWLAEEFAALATRQSDHDAAIYAYEAALKVARLAPDLKEEQKQQAAVLRQLVGFRSANKAATGGSE